MRKNFYEIFEEVEQASDTNAKIAILRKNYTPALIQFFRNVYSPAVQFTVKKIPAYKPGIYPPGLGETSIDMELKTSYLFEDRNPRKPANLAESRVNQILIQILESLEPKEAKIFESMLQKKIDYPSVSRALVIQAFPDHAKAAQIV